MSQPNINPEASDLRMTETAEALSTYAALVGKHGLQSAEARECFERHKQLPEFDELAQEIRRMESWTSSRELRCQAPAPVEPRRFVGVGVVLAVTLLFLLAGFSVYYLATQRIQGIQDLAIQKEEELKTAKKTAEEVITLVGELPNIPLAAEEASQKINGTKALTDKVDAIESKLLTKIHNEMDVYVEACADNPPAYSTKTIRAMGKLGQQKVGEEVAKVIESIERIATMKQGDADVQATARETISNLRVRVEAPIAAVSSKKAGAER
jgi:hypothetical protein